MVNNKRIRLRTLTLADVDEVFAYRSLPEVSKYQTWPSTVDELRDTVVNLTKREFGTPGWFQLGIALRADGKLIGDAAVRILETDSRIAEVAITIKPEFQSQGYGTETISWILNVLFSSEHSVHRVFASVDPRNFASAALFERVGFRKEAHFKESLWFKGQWVDDLIFGMLAKEWAGRKGDS